MNKMGTKEKRKELSPDRSEECLSIEIVFREHESP
jgi:hypothetical protein